MKQKNKKKISILVVGLFFLVTGLWYFFINRECKEETGIEPGIIGVLEQNDKEENQRQDAEQQVSTVPVKNTSETKVIVYVCGAVNTPGIYTLEEDSRLYEAVAKAGGFSKEADPSYHNLARLLVDGERIYILSYAETKELDVEEQIKGQCGQADVSEDSGGKINLNTATEEQLVTLPGIGEAKAEAILEYRRRVGMFKNVEEIKNVSGIGEAMFEKIREKIMVK